jgi:hypothetical protein
MKRKTSNSSIAITNDTKNPNDKKAITEPLVIAEYFNIHTMNYHPATHKFIEQEAARLREWSLLDDSFRLSDFYDTRGYNQDTFYDWSHKFLHMKEAHNFAKRRIASRREQASLTRKFDNTTVFKTQAFYDYVLQQEIDKANAVRLSYAQQATNNQSNEQRVVVIERFPSLAQDVEVVSYTTKTPEDIAANIHRNTATQRSVRVNNNVGDAIE